MRDSFFTGIQELKENAKKYGDAGEKAIGSGLFRAAHDLATDIQNAAPVGSKVHPQTGNARLGVSWLAKTRYPGNLKRSIVVQRVKTGEMSGSGVGFRVGPNKSAFYAYFLEYSTKRMPAHPFIRPVFDANQDRYVGSVADAVKAELGAMI
jgi:HK97 gp10 family phage protein